MDLRVDLNNHKDSFIHLETEAMQTVTNVRDLCGIYTRNQQAYILQFFQVAHPKSLRNFFLVLFV